MGQVHSHLH